MSACRLSPAPPHTHTYDNIFMGIESAKEIVVKGLQIWNVFLVGGCICSWGIGYSWQVGLSCPVLGAHVFMDDTSLEALRSLTSAVVWATMLHADKFIKQWPDV